MTTDELLKQINEKIDGCHRPGCSCWITAKDVKDAIRTLPVFQPQEPKDWPDGDGLWLRHGVSVRAVTEYHTQGDTFSVMLPGDSSRRYCCNGDILHGDWLPVTPLTPSVKEPERVEPPPRLRAKTRENGNFLWFFRDEKDEYDRYWIRGSRYTSKEFCEIDRLNSDQPAVDLYDADMKETEGKS